MSTMATPTELYLIRHGETAAEFRGRCYGSLDVALSVVGVRQIEMVAASLSSTALSAIYSSPRTRCVDSARLVARHQSCAVSEVAALSELNFGHFEGKPYTDIAMEHPELFATWMQHPTEVQFPGGESFDEMRARVLKAVNTLLNQHAGSRFAIVTHGGVKRIVLADALDLPRPNFFRLGQRYGAINLIRYQGGVPIVELMNQ